MATIPVYKSYKDLLRGKARNLTRAQWAAIFAKGKQRGWKPAPVGVMVKGATSTKQARMKGRRAIPKDVGRNIKLDHADRGEGLVLFPQVSKNQIAMGTMLLVGTDDPDVKIVMGMKLHTTRTGKVKGRG